MNNQSKYLASGFKIALAVFAFTCSQLQLKGQEQGFVEEVWTDVIGNTVASLTQSPKYPNAPDSSRNVNGASLELQTAGSNFGAKYSGYLVPPTDGPYTFAIAADDAAELWVSIDENPANIALVASVPAWTSVGQFDKYVSQISLPTELRSGNGYYFEILYKENSGGFNMRVAWKDPDYSGPLTNNTPAIAPEHLFLSPPPKQQTIQIESASFVGEQFQLNGKVGLDGEFTLWKSVDLIEWSPILSSESAEGSLRIDHISAPGEPKSFYRISDGNHVPGENGG